MSTHSGHFFLVPELRLVEATTPAPPSAGTAVWVLSEPNQSCDEACDAHRYPKCLEAELAKASSEEKPVFSDPSFRSLYSILKTDQ